MHPAGAEGGSEHLLLGAALLPSPLCGHQCELPGYSNPQLAGPQGPCDPIHLSPSTACPPLPSAPTGTLTVSPQGSLDQGHSLLIRTFRPPLLFSQGSSSRPCPSPCPGTIQALLTPHALSSTARAPSSLRCSCLPGPLPLLWEHLPQVCQFPDSRSVELLLRCLL